MKYYPEGVNDALNKKFDTLAKLKEAMMNGEILESRVLICDKDHNLHVDLGIAKGIIPREEGAIGIGEGKVRDIALISKVNKRVCFTILGFHRDEYGNTNAILSRRSVQLACMKNYINKLNTGDIIDAKVTHLEKFGAFIDIGAGINSLIPIDMLSVSRISHPEERLHENQNIKAVLKKREDDKLTFSLKELLGTWEENALLFCHGETVTGVVRSIESYGVFVELMPNLAGLAEPCDNLEVGSQVSVFIKSVIPEKMKIKLIIVSAFENTEKNRPLSYFVLDDHIDKWIYSPKASQKEIFTEF